MQTEELLSIIKEEAGEETANELKDTVLGKVAPNLKNDFETESEPGEEAKKTTDLRTQLADLGVAEKIKVAMFGNGACRRLLVLDPSKMIQEAVLSNPKLQLEEIEEFVRNPNMPAAVIRSIAGNSTWMRQYKIKSALVYNPKCPPDLSLKYLRFLNSGDVKQISRSKNVPHILQVAAKKRLQEEEKKS